MKFEVSVTYRQRYFLTLEAKDETQALAKLDDELAVRSVGDWLKMPDLQPDFVVKAELDGGDYDALKITIEPSENPYDHNSSPNGCHEDCPACAWETTQTVTHA